MNRIFSLCMFVAASMLLPNMVNADALGRGLMLHPADTGDSGSGSTAQTKSTLSTPMLQTLSAGVVVPGAIQGELSVAAAGAVQYQIPLTLPPGVSGLMPSLSFQYNSHGDNGLMGVGWSLSGLPVISRCAKTLAQDGNKAAITLGAEDRFCLNGKRLVLVDGAAYGADGAEYRTELEEFSRVISHTSVPARGPDSFTVWTRSGLVMSFGDTTDSRLLANETVSTANSSSPYGFSNTINVASGQQVLRWAASKVSDRNSNYYTISYITDALTGEQYPDVISYTGNDAPGETPALPTNTVTFSYEPRPTIAGSVAADYPLQYLGTSRVHTSQRLKDVQVAESGQLLRKYYLSYQTLDPEQQWSMRSRLENVQECTFDDQGSEFCYAPTSFEMSPFSECIYDSYKSDLATTTQVGTVGGLAGTYVPLAQDFDGDGRTDLVAVKLGSEGVTVLSTFSQNSVPSGTDFSDTTICKSAQKQGQAFSATTLSTLSSENLLTSENWVVTAGDVDADGVPEIVAIPLRGGLDPLVATRQGAGYQLYPSASVQDTSDYSSTNNAFYSAKNTTKAMLMDVDGDGKNDIVSIKRYGGWSAPNELAFFIRKGLGDGTFAQTVRENFSAANLFAYADPYISAGDVNGDGRGDIVVAASVAQTNSLQTFLGGDYVGTGKFFIMHAKQNILPSSSGAVGGIGYIDTKRTTGEFSLSTSLVDVNRDGKSDLVFFRASGTTTATKNRVMTMVALGTESGDFIPPDEEQGYISSIEWLGYSGFLYDFPWRLVYTDINGDGRVDILVTQVLPDPLSGDKNRLLIGVLLNRGDGRFVFGGSGWSTTASAPSLQPEGAWSRLSGDFDGDGLGDMISVEINTTNGFDAFPVFTRGPLPDLLTKVTDGNGKVTEVVQAPLTRNEVYSKGFGAVFPDVDIRIPLYVARKVTRDSGNELASPTWTYSYEKARVNLQGRGMLGFGAVIEGAPTGITTTTTYSQTFPYIGMPATIVSKVGPKTSVDITRTLDSKVISHPSGKTTYFPYVSESVAAKFEPVGPTGTPYSYVRTNDTYDNWGSLLTRVSEIANSWGDWSTGTNVKTHTQTNTYYANTINATNWRVGELERTEDHRVTPVPGAANSDITRTSEFEYDSLGRLWKQIVEPDTLALSHTREIGRDRFGNETSVTVSGTDIVTRVESRTYDVSGRFVTSQTNAQDHVTGPIVTDPRFGLPLSVKSPNNVYAVREYDTFGRVTLEKVQQTNGDGSISDGPSTTTEYQACTACDTSKGEAYEVIVTATGSAPVVTFVDRLGRARRSKATHMTGISVYSVTEYDALGRKRRQSKPYLAGQFETYWTEWAYDSLGRLTSETLPGNRVTNYYYEARMTQVTNSKSQVIQRTEDALGQLISMRDANYKVQSYIYDAFGNLIKTQDANGNSIVTTYDTLGRKTAQSDPDMGDWGYQYNVLGELLWQQDGKGQITTFAYDKLGRMTSRTEADLISTWVWDTAAKGIGKLASVSGDNGFSRSYGYDALSRLVSTTTDNSIDPFALVSDPDFTHTTSYDAAGRVEIETYPDGFAYRNIYDGYGYLSEVRDAASNDLYWRADTRDTEGFVTRETLGNGLTTARARDLETGFVTKIETGTLSSSAPWVVTPTVQDDTYNYDTLGNLTLRSQYFDTVSLVETFGYDALNRLASVTPLNDLAENISYDDLGNIQSRTSVGSYSYVGCGGSHRVCATTGRVSATYSYDANGNMVSDGTRSLSWTAANYVSQIVEGTTSEAFLYSPDRERVRVSSSQSGATTTTLYLNPRIDTGNTFEKVYAPNGDVTYTHYLYAGGRLIGSVETELAVETVSYFHTDHLGSITAITDASGAVIERLSYDAWGMRREPDGSKNLAVTSLWSTDLTVAPTTANPNSEGITLDASPAIYWQQDSGDGYLVLDSDFQTVNQHDNAIRQESYEGERVLFRAEFTPVTKYSGQSPRRRAYIGVTEGVAAYMDMRNPLEAHYIDIEDDRITIRAKTLYEYGAGKPNDIEFQLTEGTTFVVEIDSSPLKSTLYLYEKGQTRADGEVHTMYRALPAGDVRKFQMSVERRGRNGRDSANVRVDNLSEDLLSDAASLPTTAQRHGYTAHEHIDTVGLINMNGRIFNPVIGRFMSPDPNVFYPENPQDFNRYSYVHNNPLSFVDPSGFAMAPMTDGEMSGFGASVSMPDKLFEYAISSSSFQSYQNYVSYSNSLGGSYANVTVTSSSSSSTAASNQHGGSNVTVGNGGGSVGGMSPLSEGELSDVWGAGFPGAGNNGDSLQRSDVTLARMAQAVYGVTDADAGTLVIDGYVLNSIYTDGSGMKAALFVGGDSSVLSFAGTSPSSWDNWKANLSQAFGFSSAQYNAGIFLALSLGGNVHFTGHSLGGGIAAAAAIVTGGNATIFNAAGVHSNTLRGYAPSNGSVTYYYSSFDVLRIGNALTPARVPGEHISLGAAGFHGMGGVCRAMGC